MNIPNRLWNRSAFESLKTELLKSGECQRRDALVDNEKVRLVAAMPADQRVYFRDFAEGVEPYYFTEEEITSCGKTQRTSEKSRDGTDIPVIVLVTLDGLSIRLRMFSPPVLYDSCGHDEGRVLTHLGLWRDNGSSFGNSIPFKFLPLVLSAAKEWEKEIQKRIKSYAAWEARKGD